MQSDDTTKKAKRRLTPKITFGLALIGASTAVAYRVFQYNVWWVGYDIRNCPGCLPAIDWSAEEESVVVGQEVRQQFEQDGVIILPQALPVQKVNDVARIVDAMPNTIMTDVFARTFLPHYLRYEHHLDTRSQALRDWAIHGPLGKWAAQLMGTDQVLLYNAEAIYHRGQGSPRPCQPAWHRDTIAAPFASDVKSVTFNVYFDDIGADEPNGDVLIYMKGSHKDLDKPPADPTLFEPNIRVGDVLAHNPNIYHTPSGRGCWKRRSLQFRFVAGLDSANEPTRFQFDINRWPHGPIPWSLAQAPELYPHGLNNGDLLSGPGYPLVYPKPLVEEHVPLDGNVWTLRRVLNIAKASGAQLRSNQGNVPEGFLTLDGPVGNVDDWVIIKLPQANIDMPMHKLGPGYSNLMKSRVL